MKNADTYYDRKMCSEIVNHINLKLSWLIQYVKDHPSLDFQTGHDPKMNRSWFSIYRGTGRVFTIEAINNKIKPYFAADAYVKLMPELFEEPSPELFDKYLSIIESEPKFDRYYKGSKGIPKEGYFQGLIGRRYTFNLTDDDDFVIIDKEFVIGFKDEATKKDWNEDKIIPDQIEKIKEFRDQYKGKLPKEIKASYGEFDFLALNKNGDILIMELKQDDPQKTALAPIQTNYYYRQFEKLMKEDSLLSNKINYMIAQKIELGIISDCFKNNLPVQLSGRIIPCVIVGEEEHLSDTICERYKFARNLFLPAMLAYTCEDNGTLVKSKKLE
jgi:hypothetical protein